MYKKTIYFALIVSIAFDVVDAKRSRKNKRPSDEDSTPQPNVVTYSTFGFNDVGAYEGFVPSSPDYANYLSNYNQESSTRLYAPAFPTALESSGFNSNYGSQAQDGQSFSGGDSGGPQASMSQYPQNSMSFFNTPSLDGNDAQSSNAQISNTAPEEGYGINTRGSQSNAPIYGAKLGSRNRSKSVNLFNNTDYNIYNGGSSNPTDVQYSTFHEVQPAYEHKPTSFSESNKNYHQQNSFDYSPTYPSTDDQDFIKAAPSNLQSSIKFPKVIDFTKLKQYYSSNIENKFPTATVKTPSTYKSVPNIQNENTFGNNFEDHSSSFYSPQPPFKETLNIKGGDETVEKEVSKPYSYPSNDFSHNQVSNSYSNNKNSLKNTQFNFDYKDKLKYRPWSSTNYTNDYKNWKSPVKGYQYSTDHSNATFEFDFGGPKKPSNNNNEEIIPASSNLVDYSSQYQFPDTDFSTFKKIPGEKGQFDEDDYIGILKSLKQQDGKYDQEEYVKSSYSTVPTTTTLWGNVYKTSEYSSYKQHPKKPQYIDEINDEVVHIPKRPYGIKYNYAKYTESKPSELPTYNNYRPYKPKKPASDWTKEAAAIRFKPEEDLLGLRTHDTSHPSYLPSYRPGSNTISSDYDYKNLVEKWRQSYMKAKYRDALNNDFDSYPSEPRPLHVPVPRPYPIEVPHPVIVPVLQPYPVRVPVPKPVAVPVIRELIVPIEKPVPYPVVKKVPFPVEKLVPVPVEKEVQVPVVKPYPVHIPHVRPVFHHSRPRDEMDAGIDIDEEHDYRPRPESSKRIPYAKKIRSSRNRTRRPSRPAYYDRNRRRWPSRRPGTYPEQRHIKRPTPHSQPFKYHDSEPEDFEQNDHTDYYTYCKRTGNC